MSKNFWVISRPKRKLILVPDLLKIFEAVAEGKQWKGNREIQAEFEEALTQAQWKRQHKSKDASGARTYATLLYMLGLWFEDENGVHLTNAGVEIVNDEPPIPILTKQLIDFQYPSPYSTKRNVNIDRNIKIQPHRFVLKLFTEKGFNEITQNEIAFCVIPYAKRMEDIDKCTEIILAFRANQEGYSEKAEAITGTTADNLRNVANTMINQLEYTGFFDFDEQTDIKSLTIVKDKLPKLKETISKQRNGLISLTDELNTFQIRYGEGLNKSKDYRASQARPMEIDPNTRKILITYQTIAVNEPINAITKSLIERIDQQTGIGYSKIETVLNNFALKPSLDRFQEKYIQLSTGGNETAKEFEAVSFGFFSEGGFGFEAKLIANQPRNPDIVVYFDHINLEHGIIDTKAYREYNLSLDHKNVMVHTYIPKFKTIEYNGKTYKLKFFNYIAGGFSPSMARSFKEFKSMTDVNGSFITSMNFLHLLNAHRAKPIKPQRFGEIFSLNKEVKLEDINSITKAD